MGCHDRHSYVCNISVRGHGGTAEFESQWREFSKPAQEGVMQDLLWMAVTIAFFALSIAYVHFCERVK